jgi:hypothetical protein
LKKPPPLPRDTLQKVIKITRANGWSIALIAGAAVLVTLAITDWFGVAMGALVASAGVIEVSGSRLLQGGDKRGSFRIEAAQLWLLSILWGYSIFQMSHFDYQEIYANLPQEVKTLLYSSGLANSVIESKLRLVYAVIYGGVMLGSLLHQGGLFFFYRRCTRAIHTALEGEEDKVG